MRAIRSIFADSYRSDKIAFYLEMTNFAFSVTGSGLLAITAADPTMWMIYPLYLVGSITRL